MVEVRLPEPHVFDVLRAAGVKTVEWTLPAELKERHEGDPVSVDEVLDFHEALSQPNWFAELTAND